MNKKNNNAISFNDKQLSSYTIKIQTFSNNEITSLALPENKDLIPGQYEGGLKIWECSLDLCNFLPEQFNSNSNISNMHILELGCGHGFPGLYFLLKGASVVFQDFNPEVLSKVTRDYIQQLDKEYNLKLENKAEFIDGDWSQFSSKLSNTKYKDTKFDLIISAETLYNINNYDKIYTIIKENMNSSTGKCYFATKKFYFGVGGSSRDFIDYIESKKEFCIKRIKEYDDGFSNIRHILEINSI